MGNLTKDGEKFGWKSIFKLKYNNSIFLNSSSGKKYLSLDGLPNPSPSYDGLTGKWFTTPKQLFVQEIIS